MTGEFKIRFSYNNRPYSARVISSLSNNRMTYAVRPFSLALAKGFGPQVLISQKDNQYSCESRLAQSTPDYINAIVTGLRNAKR